MGVDIEFKSDEDGDVVCGGERWELMQGSAVRVLVPTDISTADAVRLLRKVTSPIEREFIERLGADDEDRDKPY